MREQRGAQREQRGERRERRWAEENVDISGGERTGEGRGEEREGEESGEDRSIDHLIDRSTNQWIDRLTDRSSHRAIDPSKHKLQINLDSDFGRPWRRFSQVPTMETKMKLMQLMAASGCFEVQEPGGLWNCR